MPRTYARNHRQRGGLPFGAVATAQSQAANPYRMHRPDPLVNGVSNLAAALFRAPAERAQIEDSRAARAAESAHRTDRETKDDLFREKQLETSHSDAQARIKAMGDAHAAATAGKGATGPKLGTIPSFVRSSEIDPVTGKITYGQRPINDTELGTSLKNQERVRTAGALGQGLNPGNGQPLGSQNPYAVPKPPEMAASDDLFTSQARAANDPHAVDPTVPQHQAAQVQLISQKVAALHPEDQKDYGMLLSALARAQQSGDPQAVAAAGQKIQIANARLLGQTPPPPSAANSARWAADDAHAGGMVRQGLGVMPPRDDLPAPLDLGVGP